MGLAATYSGGLADPVFGSQEIFRLVMDAMAHPGRIADLGNLVDAPEPLNAASACVLAALADYDTPIWFEAEMASQAKQWLTFQTGAPLTEDAGQAAFALLSPESSVTDWGRFAVGTASYPDRSATLLLPVHSLDNGTPLTLTGPGIETQVTITVDGLPEGFLPTMTANRSRFPLGFDMILTVGSKLLALPRSTRIGER